MLSHFTSRLLFSNFLYIFVKTHILCHFLHIHDVRFLPGVLLLSGFNQYTLLLIFSPHISLNNQLSQVWQSRLELPPPPLDILLFLFIFLSLGKWSFQYSTTFFGSFLHILPHLSLHCSFPPPFPISSTSSLLSLFVSSSSFLISLLWTLVLDLFCTWRLRSRLKY